MIQFVNPINGSKIINTPGTKSVEIVANYGSPIVSPYRGVISDINNDNVTILHNINNQNVYSKFSGINRPQVGINVPLKKGESFAYCDTSNIKYSILDKNGKTMKVEPFFNGFEYDDTKISDKEPNAGHKSKTEFSKDPTPGKSYTADFLSHIALKPFDMIYDKLRPKTKKEKEEKDLEQHQKVNEEINRIKQLLK